MHIRRDHGGDLDRVRRAGEDWLDLSTGINPQPYPVPPLPAEAWATLPTQSAITALTGAAAAAYGAHVAPVPLAGAQAAIQIVPRLAAPGQARVLGPTYNEHAAALALQGWRVATVDQIEALAGADLAVIVNPNNPDGRHDPPERILDLAPRVGLLVVDESFVDPRPELSVVPWLGRGPGNVVVLRSFGKFYGLAGLRLGFALAGDTLAHRTAELAGPWAVSGPAIAVGRVALADRGWADRTRQRLGADAARLDRLAGLAGWTLVGGTPLFRTYETGDAPAAQQNLARARIWSRIFPYSTGWLRLGLPGREADWERLHDALAGQRE